MENSITKKQVKAILLDYGGTIDTNGVHWSEVIYDGYRSANANVAKEDFRKAYVYAEQYMEKNPTLVKPDDTFKETLLKKIRLQSDFYVQQALPYDISQQVEAIAAYCYTVAKNTTAEAAKTLAMLHKRYLLVLVSNFYGNLQSVIKDYDIAKYFTSVVESSVVGVRKPNPEIFRIALERLNIQASETIVVGDSFKNDIVPAYQLGCTSVWLKGIGWEAEDEQGRHTKEASHYIKSFNELAELIDITE